MDQEMNLSSYLQADPDQSLTTAGHNWSIGQKQLQSFGMQKGGDFLTHPNLGVESKLSNNNDQQSLMMAQLQNDINNIRETQMQYNLPPIGDLFRPHPSEVQETINSIYFMLKQRISDLDNRNEFRNKILKAESQAADSNVQLQKARTKIDQQQKEIIDLKNKLIGLEQKQKGEIQRLEKEREELIKSMTKIEHKESQYKHEIKNKELQITKMQDQIKKQQEVSKKASNKENFENMQTTGKILPSNEVIFSVQSSERDLSNVIVKSYQDMFDNLQKENRELKDCLKSLQRELFDIVRLKSEIYTRRFKAELYTPDDPLGKVQSEDVLRHEIEKIKEELFNLPFEENSREMINQFRINMSKLKCFMESVDKNLGSLKLFDQKTEGDIQPKEEEMATVTQLKELLGNYEALVESQHDLMQTSITKIAAIPAPDELAQTFKQFKVLNEDELDDMRKFLNEHRDLMRIQNDSFEIERQQFEEMNRRMEAEKIKVVQERQKIEHEIKSIRALNEDFTRQTM